MGTSQGRDLDLAPTRELKGQRLSVSLGFHVAALLNSHCVTSKPETAEWILETLFAHPEIRWSGVRCGGVDREEPGTFLLY